MAMLEALCTVDPPYFSEQSELKVAYFQTVEEDRKKMVKLLQT